MNSRAFTMLAALALAACAGDAAPSSSAAATSSPNPSEADESATPSPSEPTASSEVVESPSSTPSPSAVVGEPQVLTVGSIVEPAISGVRVRSQPGTGSEQLDTLPDDAVGLVDLGPLYADGYAWYRLIYYPTEADGKGWVASGPRSAPWLVASDRRFGDHGPIQGFAGTGSASVGPIEFSPQSGLQWAAVGDDCQLDIVLHSGSEQISAVSSAVGGYAEGSLPADFFIVNSSFVGSFTIEVASSCSWALSIVVFIG